MSIQANIGIVFDREMAPTSFLSALLDAGWGGDYDGSISLLSDFSQDWVRVKNLDGLALKAWFSGVESARTDFGCVFVHQQSGVGGVFMISDGWKSLSWLVNINRPVACFSDVLTDYTACFEVLWPVINRLSIPIESLNCTQ